MKYLIAAAMIAASTMTALAQDFDKGLAAFRDGDYATALGEFRPLAEQGHTEAQFYLGQLHDHGLGVPEDDAEAVRWYRLAAEKGFALAQFSLGNKYFNGEGVPEDDAQAVRWLRLAAEKGEANAQTNLGNMYRNGLGLSQDYVASYMWFRIASALGAPEAAADYHKIAEVMEPEQIAEAQRRAKVCMESNYKDCDDPNWSWR